MLSAHSPREVHATACFQDTSTSTTPFTHTMLPKRHAHRIATAHALNTHARHSLACHSEYVAESQSGGCGASREKPLTKGVETALVWRLALVARQPRPRGQHEGGGERVRPVLQYGSNRSQCQETEQKKDYGKLVAPPAIDKKHTSRSKAQPAATPRVRGRGGMCSAYGSASGRQAPRARLLLCASDERPRLAPRGPNLYNASIEARKKVVCDSVR